MRTTAITSQRLKIILIKVLKAPDVVVRDTVVDVDPNLQGFQCIHASCSVYLGYTPKTKARIRINPQRIRQRRPSLCSSLTRFSDCPCVPIV